MTAVVEHGITVVDVPASTSLQASCLCGWSSGRVPSRPVALREGYAHLGEHHDGVQEIVARVEASPEVAGELVGLTDAERAEVLRAAAGAVVETILRQRGAPRL